MYWRAEVKAGMNSDMPVVETAATFFFLANRYLKQGISSEYVMVDFICEGSLELWGTQVENYKINFFPTMEYEPDNFRFRIAI